MRIQINLLPGEKKRRAAGPGFKLPDFKALLATVKDPWLAGAAGAWILVAAVAFLTFVGQTRTLATLEPEVQQLRQEKSRYDRRIAEMRRAQRFLDTLRTELGVIRDIDADRYTWAHILDQLSKALPQYTWLTALTGSSVTDSADTTGKTRSVRADLTGRTVDIQAFASFLRQLEASPWLGEVTPVSVINAIEAERSVQEFNITFKFRQADSAFRRFVSVLQSTTR